MRRFIEEYAKHAALNFGQALQGIRYLHSHPDVDAVAPRGTIGHFVRSLRLRSARVGNDLCFAVLPPRWHHSREELEGMTRISARRWFEYGYCAWRFTDEGMPKSDLSQADRRWDPRCK